MDDGNFNCNAEALDKEIRELEERVARAENDNEKRLLKRRLKQTRYMRLMLLGQLG